jgi:hypothetical protein
MAKTLAVCLLALLATLLSKNAVAQNAGDMMNMFSAIMRAAMADHARVEWSKIPQNESSCIDEALQRQGYSVSVMIQNGIAPTDPRISNIRSSCRTSVVSLPPSNTVDIQSLSSKPTIDCTKASSLTARTVCQNLPIGT